MKKFITLHAKSKFKRFLKLRKFKKEHRNVKVIVKDVDVIERGYKGLGYCNYWVTVQYDA